MTLTRAVSTGRTGLQAFLRELFARDPRLFAVAVGNAVLFAVFAVGTAVDPATVSATTGGNVEPRWLKPAKFAGSIALFTGTLGWLGVHLPVSDRRRRRVSSVVAVGSAIEIALIAGQAARGVESHFNMTTPLNGAIYGLMGLAILVTTAAVAWLAVQTLRGRFEVHPAFAAGIQLGLVTFVIGAIEGGAMVGLATDTVVRGPHIAVLGWTPTGDLRIAHFIGLHGWQLLPLVGYLAARWERMGRVADGRRLVHGTALGYISLFTAALALAIAPLI